MRISGVMPLRNAVKLGYPFEPAIRSLRPLCDEVIVLVDPMSEDDTLERVRALAPDVLVLSEWDMTNHQGLGQSEVAKQTAVACARASGDWILSLQADEMLHEGEVSAAREDVERAESEGISALALTRVYFYGGLHQYRDNWTVPCLRLFERDRWVPDRFSGAMQFVPSASGERSRAATAKIYHYSRVGDPAAVARRVRNLDTFYHDPKNVASAEVVQEYDFGVLRKLDTYVLDHQAEEDSDAKLVPFDTRLHPALALEFFR